MRLVTFEKNVTLSTVPHGWTPKDSCDDLDIDVLAVVGSAPADKFLPCGMRVIKDVVPLSLCPVNCCGEFLEGMSNELGRHGRRREVVVKRPPVAAASDILPGLRMCVTIDGVVKLDEKHWIASVMKYLARAIGAVSALILKKHVLVVNDVIAVDGLVRLDDVDVVGDAHG